MRSHRGGPIAVLLLARSGELSDNEASLRALRGIRRQTSIVELELELGPHPHDVPRERLLLPDGAAFCRLLGPPNELERFGRAAIERFGLEILAETE